MLLLGFRRNDGWAEVMLYLYSVCFNMTYAMVCCHQPTDCTVTVTTTSPTPQPSLDKKVFLPTFILVMIIGALLVLKPESAQLLLGDALQVVTGLFRLVVSPGELWRHRAAYLAGVQSLRAGKVRRPDDGLEFSTLSWIAMMFTVGIGIGLTNWAFVEPIFYFQSPPFGIEAGTPEAAEWAHMYGQFHWSIVPWAIYALPAFADCLFPVCPKTAFLQDQYCKRRRARPA